MTARVLMVQGVASTVGKSILTAGLCRVYARRGFNVAPFKAQNMSNNAAVTPDGEIGRAQALQARAAGIEPSVDMNPILLKPEHGHQSQVVVRGKVAGHRSGRDYFNSREQFWPVVTDSLDRLRAQYEIVLIEGAGSPAEVNLRHWDIVNMRVACYAEAPVLLVADVDRGGALAALVGTMALLEPEEQDLVQGFLINRFRGDTTLFTPALKFLQERTGVPVLGMIPYIDALRLPSEDSAALDASYSPGCSDDIVAIRLPHISNFDDLDPLVEIGASVRWIAHPRDLGKPAMIVLPGSKSTRADLEFLWSSGLAASIRAATARGVLVLGICGGYQMLGSELVDPHGLEGNPGSTPGLALLDARTSFEPDKVTRHSMGRVIAAAGPLASIAGSPVRGYEIHDGETQHHESALLEIGEGAQRRAEGAVSASGRVIGTYLHGFLDNAAVLGAVSQHLKLQATPGEHASVVDRELDRLADVVQASVDVAKLDALIGLA
jgi:adenosylcobyric acid synthase